MKIKSYIEGLKLANLTKFLMSSAWEIGLEITILERDKGFIRETIYFELEGTEEKLKIFNKVLKSMVAEYNI